MRRLIVEEPLSRAAVWSRRVAIFALATAIMAVGVARLGANPGGALVVFGAALTLAFVALLLSAAAAVVIWRTGRRGAGGPALLPELARLPLDGKLSCRRCLPAAVYAAALPRSAKKLWLSVCFMELIQNRIVHNSEDEEGMPSVCNSFFSIMCLIR